MKTPPRKHLFSTVIHILCIVGFVILAGASIACNDRKQTDSSTFKVALLTPGPITDQAWNANAYQALLTLKDSLNAHISHVQTKTPADIEENFRQYGRQEYQLVFGNGFEFQDAALRVAPEFPNTIYVNVSATATAPNVAALEFTFGEGAYLAGIIAGSQTKTNTIGVIGGMELPPVVTAFKAFEDGAKSVNPEITVISSYLGNWDDVSAGKEQALAQISRGADIIFHNADAAGLGVFQAAKESESRQIRVIGANSDQNNVAPDVTLGSVIINLPHAFLLVAQEVLDKSFTPRIITLGAREGVIEWIPNPKLAHEIAPKTSALVDSIDASIREGTFTLLP